MTSEEGIGKRTPNCVCISCECAGGSPGPIALTVMSSAQTALKWLLRIALTCGGGYIELPVESCGGA